MTSVQKWLLSIVAILVLIALGFSLVFAPQSKKPPPANNVAITTQEANRQLSRALMLWGEGQYQPAKQILSSLDQQSLPDSLQTKVRLLHYYSEQYLPQSGSLQVEQFKALPASCMQQILFVSAQLSSLEQAEQFKQAFAKDSRLARLPICIYPRLWLAPKNLDCQANWQQTGRLGCNLLPLAAQLKELPFTHLVIFANKGKANVHNGIMFLDSQDTYDVFIHELAHFSGFVDEYPLTQALAKRVCKGVEAPNLVFQQKPQDAANQHYWQTLGLSHQQELFAARTCNNHAAQAFKTSNSLTFMEYHDTAFIPKQYLKAWRQQLLRAPNQPSAHVNFAQLFEATQNATESQFWRAKYQQYLKTNAP